MHIRVLLLVAVAFLLQACVGPNGVGRHSHSEDAGANGPSLLQLQQVTEPAAGAAVRWGGELVSVREQNAMLRLELVQRPLDRRGKPRPEAASAGRFLALIPRTVLDAAQANALASAQSRQLVTVLGVAGKPVEGAVGNQAYRFAVVETQIIRLWPGLWHHHPGYFRDAPLLQPWPYDDPFLPTFPHRFYRGRFGRFPHDRSRLHLQFELNRYADWYVEDVVFPWYHRRWWGSR